MKIFEIFCELYKHSGNLISEHMGVELKIFGNRVRKWEF